jgi:hypothetical protein
MTSMKSTLMVKTNLPVMYWDHTLKPAKAGFQWRDTEDNGLFRERLRNHLDTRIDELELFDDISFKWSQPNYFAKFRGMDSLGVEISLAVISYCYAARTERSSLMLGNNATDGHDDDTVTSTIKQFF